MTFVELLVFVAFMAFFCWWLYRFLIIEKRRNDAFVKKENAQRIMYERLLQKLSEDEPWVDANAEEST